MRGPKKHNIIIFIIFCIILSSFVVIAEESSCEDQENESSSMINELEEDISEYNSNPIKVASIFSWFTNNHLFNFITGGSVKSGCESHKSKWNVYAQYKCMKSCTGKSCSKSQYNGKPGYECPSGYSCCFGEYCTKDYQSTKKADYRTCKFNSECKSKKCNNETPNRSKLRGI